MARSVWTAAATALLALTVHAPLFAQSSPTPYTSYTRLDAGGRVVGTIAPDPDGAGPRGYAAVRNTYDAHGLLTKVETGELVQGYSGSYDGSAPLPSQWTTSSAGFDVQSSVETTYDTMGRKTLETTKGSDAAVTAKVQYSYDALGLLWRCKSTFHVGPYRELLAQPRPQCGPKSSQPRRINYTFIKILVSMLQRCLKNRF